MLAYTYIEKGKFGLTEKPKPKITDARDAIVRVTLGSICTSDLHIKHGSVPRAILGTTVGHEMVGVVEEVGTGVTSVKPGDRVTVNVETFCGKCFFCQHGYVNNCTDLNGGWALGCRIDGGQAEYVRVPYADQGLNRIPDTVSDALIFLGTSLPLPQLRREHDLPRLRALGPDEAVVSLGNAPGDGEPHTEAAVGGAGLIRPIEPVKELLCLPLSQRRTGIAAPQDDTPFSLLQHKPDGRLRQGILHGVIQQDRHQLPHGVLVAAVGKPRHDSKLQRMALRPGKIPEGLRRLLHRLADGEVRQLQRRFLLVHAGERHRGPAEAEISLTSSLFPLL